MKPIIVIGSGMAGISLIRELRKLDTSSAIMLITADDGGFYSKPMLSNAFAQNKLPSQLKTQSAAQLAEQLNITVLHKTSVEAIDTAQQMVKTSLGEFQYRDLILSLGANPIRLAINGSGANDIISVNHLDHYAQFRHRLEQLSQTKPELSIAILGAGLIGCEFADDLNHAGFSVHVIDPNPRPLAALLPPAIADQLQQKLEAQGVQLHLQTSTTQVDKTGDAYQVQLSNGASIQADLVLSAVGLAPQTSLAKLCSPLALATDRGILVDRFGRTSAPHVYALGDCAQYASHDGTHVLLPYIAPILTGARAIARTLSQESENEAQAIEFGAMPIIIKTPSCPIAVIPPKPHQREEGTWQDSTQEDGTIVSRFLLQDGRLAGFAITPNNAKLRSELVNQLSH